MASAFEPAEHPALDLSAGKRDDYVTLVGAMVIADAHEDERELAGLGRLCDALGLPAESVKGALTRARELDAARLGELAGSFDDYFVRQQLLTDAIVIAFADGRLDAAESQKIAALAAHVGLSVRQAALIGRYVERYLKSPDHTPELRAQLGNELDDAMKVLEPKAAPGRAGGAFSWLLDKICTR